jgi:hypothetical protein
MNLAQAREIFERDVMASMPECAVVEGATREFPQCFVFVHQGTKFVETGDVSGMFVGHGPVLISREDGKVFKTGSCFPTEHYVKAFEACGDPYGVPANKVKILGWHPAADKVMAIKVVREKSEMGLSEAKAVVDSALSNAESSFTARTVGDAAQAVAELRASGFHSVQLWSNQC